MGFFTSAIIAASGNSTRMGFKYSKQFIDLNGKTVIERTLIAFENCDLIDEIIDRGIIFQVNLDSLIGENGSSAQEMSFDMVRRGIAQIIASDAHDLDYRHTRLVEKLNQLPNHITEDLVEKCLIENPQKIINNQDI